MPSSSNLLRILTDKFTPVRDTTGRLLGVVPAVRETDEALIGSNGALYQLRIAAQVCVCVNLDDPMQSPQYLNGFIPVDDKALVSSASPSGSGDDPDLAVGV